MIEDEKDENAQLEVTINKLFWQFISKSEYHNIDNIKIYKYN